MSIICKNIPSYNYFEITGRLEHDELVSLQNDIDYQMKFGSKFFLFDVAKLEYLSSSGLRTFIRTQNQLKLFDGFLLFLSPSVGVKEILGMSELSELLHVKYELKEAISEFV